MLIEIRDREAGRVLFAHKDEHGLVRHALEAAVKRGIELYGADLHSVDLNSARLRGAYLRYADLRQTNLCSADLSQTDLRDASLEGVDLSFANLDRAELAGAVFDYARLKDTLNLRRANWKGARWNLANIDIHGLPLGFFDAYQSRI